MAIFPKSVGTKIPPWGAGNAAPQRQVAARLLPAWDLRWWLAWTCNECVAYRCMVSLSFFVARWGWTWLNQDEPSIALCQVRRLQRCLQTSFQFILQDISNAFSCSFCLAPKTQHYRTTSRSVPVPTSTLQPSAAPCRPPASASTSCAGQDPAGTTWSKASYLCLLTLWYCSHLCLCMLFLSSSNQMHTDIVMCLIFTETPSNSTIFWLNEWNTLQYVLRNKHLSVKAKCSPTFFPVTSQCFKLGHCSCNRNYWSSGHDAWFDHPAVMGSKLETSLSSLSISYSRVLRSSWSHLTEATWNTSLGISDSMYVCYVYNVYIMYVYVLYMKMYYILKCIWIYLRLSKYMV